jgi:phage terminase large subunit
MGWNDATPQIKWSEVVHFTPRQQEAMEAVQNHRFVLMGGTRGPGKSYWLRWALVELMIYWNMQGFPNVRTMLGCESYPVLRDRQISKITQEFPEWLGIVKDSKTDGLGFHLHDAFGNGVMALRNLDNPEKYKGAEFAAIGVDQLEQIPLVTFNLLRGSLRWPGIRDTKFLATGNPGGVGHAWNVAYWLEKIYPPEMGNIADEFVFIRVKPDENPHLDEQYWKDLKSLPPKLQRAWLEGDYYVFSGQAFPSWSNEAHVVQPFDIPVLWPKWRGLDWGLANPFCCLWLTKDPDIGRIYVYREAYSSDMTDTQQAKMINDMTPPMEYIPITYADPSLWIRKTMGDYISTTADEFNRNGVYLQRADNDRLSGKRKVDRLLMNLPDGKPGLQVFSTCKNLIRTLPYLIYDENKAEDVDSGQEDHAYDSLRYGLTNTRYNTIKKDVHPAKHPLETTRYI